MLWTSFDYIDSIVKETSRLMPGLEVVSYRYFSLPLEYVDVRFRVSYGRKPDFIEQFVLESLGYNFKVTPAFLSSVFALDSVFTDNCIKRLKKLGVIHEDDDGGLTLTKTGKVFADNSFLPSGGEEMSLSFYFENKFGMHYKADSGKAPLYDKFDRMEEKLESKTKFISRTLIAEAGAEQGITIEVPDEGRLITSFISSSSTPAGNADYIEIWLYDFVNERLLCKVYDLQKGIYRDDIAEFISAKICPGDITSAGLYETVKGNDYVKECSELFKKAHTQYAQARFNGTASGSLVIADCFDIENIFQKYTQDISGILYINSPCLWSEIFDPEFISLIESSDFAVIGCNENLMLSERTKALLLGITDENGIPKILITDAFADYKFFCNDEIYMEGSVDYSDLGDCFSPAESVCITKDAEYSKRLKTLILESVGENYGSYNSKKLIAGLNFCLKCGETDFAMRLYNAAYEYFEDVPAVLHNLFVFAHLNDFLTATEENKDALISLGFIDADRKETGKEWSFIWN